MYGACFAACSGPAHAPHPLPRRQTGRRCHAARRVFPPEPAVTFRLGDSPRARWAALAVGWISTLIALAVILRTPADMLRPRLAQWQFWILEIQVLLLLVLTAANYRSLEH